MILFSHAAGREQVVIVEVTAHGRLITAAGDTLQLANVRAVSINDPDSLRRALALKARSFLEKQVLNQSVFVEYAADALPRLVYTLKRQGSISTINAHVLRKGYGYFIPTRNSKYAAVCRDAGDYAKTHYLGLYHLDLQLFYRPVLKTSSAFWCNGGVGIGTSGEKDFAYGKGFIKGEIAEHYRRHQWLFSIGASDGARMFWHEDIRTGYFTIGRSVFDRFFEASLSPGPAITQKVYYPDYCCGEQPIPDNRPRVIRHRPVPAWVIQAQYLVHPFKVGPAVGMSLDWNLNREVSYWIISINVALGAWNF